MGVGASMAVLVPGTMTEQAVQGTMAEQTVQGAMVEQTVQVKSSQALLSILPHVQYIHTEN